MAKKSRTPAEETCKRGSDLYQAVGGASACRKLSEAFYARVERDPVLRPLFPGKTFKCAIEEFAAFLAQFLGGPSEDAQRRWWLSLRESHLRVAIGEKERAAWMKNMRQTLAEAPIDEPARDALRRLFEEASAYVVNRGASPAVAERLSDAPGSGIHREVAERWNAQRILDEAVAAIRKRDAGRALALAESPALQGHFQGNRSVFAALLAQMIGSGEKEMLDYAGKMLLRDPALARERYSGRTLLHAAAAAGCATTTELLLRMSADPNVADDMGHTPLYCVGNQCNRETGSRVVHLLVQNGADVNADDGVKHCTALHMAARRGNVGVASALLDCGANIDARDSLGETPLRRAVNCGKIEVAKLLLARGADVHSRGSKGLTPLLAARTGPMAQLLKSAARK